MDEQQEQSITLLFLNTHRLSIPLTLTNNVSILKKYLIENWSADFIAPLDSDDSNMGFKPTSIDQIRMIHLGKPLTDDMLISDLNLNLSDIIHVSFKPVVKNEQQQQHKGLSLKRGKSTTSNENKNTNDGSASNSNVQEKNGGGCCAIV